ncbi:MAG: serine/threonine protein kinase, partial [Pseudobdellovibrionaceae bacterium]
INTSSVIAKFYRPNRWSKACIQEEHNFLTDLALDGIPAVLPLAFDQKTVFEHEGIYIALFPKVRGKMPDELNKNNFVQIGGLIARLHNVGARKPSIHRPVMNTNYYGGWPTLSDLSSLIAPEVSHRYKMAAETILYAYEDLCDGFDRDFFHRIHGDAHRGNLLSTGAATGSSFFMLDFDDFGMGPAVQDFWMLFSGEGEELEEQKELLLQGYEEFRDFDDAQWDLILPLRGMRIISYAGWIAKRWDDPSFPKIFPEFGSYKYWAEETEELEKIARLLG